MTEWYYTDNKARQGPFGEEQVAEMIKTGAIVRKTPVWKSGMTEWQEAVSTSLSSYFEDIPPDIEKPPSGSGEKNMTEWYYAGSKSSQGPFGEEQVAEMIKAGVIARKTPVWKSGMTEWREAFSTSLNTYFENKRPDIKKPPSGDNVQAAGVVTENSGAVDNSFAWGIVGTWAAYVIVNSIFLVFLALAVIRFISVYSSYLSRGYWNGAVIARFFLLGFYRRNEVVALSVISLVLCIASAFLAWTDAKRIAAYKGVEPDKKEQIFGALWGFFFAIVYLWKRATKIGDKKRLQFWICLAAYLLIPVIVGVFAFAIAIFGGLFSSGMRYRYW